MSDYPGVKRGVGAIAAIVFLSLLPQLHFCLTRGAQWQGSYVELQPDEVIYSAYVNALIDGRPLRTDPSLGQDNHPQTPLPESLFSIQFVPPLLIASIARLSGVTASSAFIVLLGASALLASFSLFWLFTSVTRDRSFAAVALIVVLCLGTLAGGQGLVGAFVKHGVDYLGLPFLRRFQPSVSFPLFFVFCTLVWQALTRATRKAMAIRAGSAGIVLAILIFSYFYLWTAALAWLVCVATLWFVLRREERSKAIAVFAIVCIPVVLALAYYGRLLLIRPAELDKAQILTLTHLPDLFRVPEVIGVLLLAALFMGMRRNSLPVNSPEAVLTLSFALLPLLLFNQQVVTGRSIQPFHYEVFIGNYVSLCGLVLLVRAFKPLVRYRTAVLIVVFCLLWSAIEIGLPYKTFYESHVRTDEMVPVLSRLKEESKRDGTWESLARTGRTGNLVFSPGYGLSELLPTWAPQGSLLAPSSISFQSLSQPERRERLFMHLYYCGKSKDYLRELLNERTDLFLALRLRSVLFGSQKVATFLGGDTEPIRQDEIEHEVASYGEFADHFSREDATKFPLRYAVKLADSHFDFSRIDQWYQRDEGERVGNYVLYRLNLRT